MTQPVHEDEQAHEHALDEKGKVEFWMRPEIKNTSFLKIKALSLYLVEVIEGGNYNDDIKKKCALLRTLLSDCPEPKKPDLLG